VFNSAFSKFLCSDNKQSSKFQSSLCLALLLERLEKAYACCLLSFPLAPWLCSGVRVQYLPYYIRRVVIGRASREVGRTNSASTVTVRVHGTGCIAVVVGWLAVVVKFHICILMRSLSRKDTSRYITGGIGECLYRMPIFPDAKRRWGAGGKTREESRRLPGWGG